MSAVRSRKKRFFKTVGISLLAAAVIALALPVWFPWVLRPVLARYGVGFDSYARVGYTRFALNNVRGQLDNAQFTGKRIVCPLPPLWLWWRYHGSSDNEPLLTVAAWNLQIQPGQTSQS